MSDAMGYRVRCLGGVVLALLGACDSGSTNNGGQQPTTDVVVVDSGKPADVEVTSDVPAATDVRAPEDRGAPADTVAADTGGEEDASTPPMDAQESCGSADDPCCATGDACRTDLVCRSNRCVRCGDMGRPCCSGDTCANDLTCMSGTCMPQPSCGGDGESCCSGSACNSGFVCSGGRCASCGGEDEPCCRGSTCGGRLTCMDGTCRPMPSCTRVAEGGDCGGSNQCCAMGTLCGSRDGTTNRCLPESCYLTPGLACTPGASDCCVDGARCRMNVRDQNACCRPVGGRCGSDRGCCAQEGATVDCDPDRLTCCIESGPCTENSQCCGRRQCVSGQCRFP